LNFEKPFFSLLLFQCSVSGDGKQFNSVAEMSVENGGHERAQKFGASDESGESGDVDVALEEDVRDELRQPPKFAVVLLNDDYTTMEFVVEVLKRFFRKTEEEAMQIMLRVHQEGRGVAGVYSHDIAETKVFQVHQLAKSRGYPLHCVIEPLK
jgi:ATP-dependent Clp protease adaptor protein ClpS